MGPRIHRQRRAPFISAFPIYFLWMACVFDPVGQMFGLKFAAILLVYALLGARLLRRGTELQPSAYHFWILALFVFLIPLHGLSVAILRGGFSGAFIDTSYVTSSVYVVCSLVYVRRDSLLVGARALRLSLRLLSAVILVSWALVSTGVFLEFVYFFVSHGAAYVSDLRDYGGTHFDSVYFTASPLLIILLAYETWMFVERVCIERFLLMLLPTCSLFLSGNRASIIMSLSGGVFVWLWHRFGRGSLIGAGAVAAAVAAIVIVLDVPVITGMFSLTEGSNSTKVGYIEHYVKMFGDPATLAFGQGYNAHAWSREVSAILPEGASKTELTYLEAVRVLGVFVSLLVLWCLSSLSLGRRIKHGAFPWLAPGLFLYFCVSALNPYLFSSNGMLLIGFGAASAGIKRARGREDDANSAAAVAGSADLPAFAMNHQ